MQETEQYYADAAPDYADAAPASDAGSSTGYGSDFTPGEGLAGFFDNWMDQLDILFHPDQLLESLSGVPLIGAAVGTDRSMLRKSLVLGSASRHRRLMSGTGSYCLSPILRRPATRAIRIGRRRSASDSTSPPPP